MECSYASRRNGFIESSSSIARSLATCVTCLRSDPTFMNSLCSALCGRWIASRRASLAAWRPAVGFIDWLGLGFVANHFDVVPVRTNDESCVVVRVVVRAQTRCTIVFATCLQSCAIEIFDLLAILGRERQVKMR